MKHTMKKLILTAMSAVPTGAAIAHQLPDEESLPAQLIHQVMSLHHLPILALAVICGLLLTGRWRTRRE